MMRFRRNRPGKRRAKQPPATVEQVERMSRQAAGFPTKQENRVRSTSDPRVWGRVLTNSKQPNTSMNAFKGIVSQPTRRRLAEIGRKRRAHQG